MNTENELILTVTIVFFISKFCEKRNKVTYILLFCIKMKIFSVSLNILKQFGI